MLAQASFSVFYPSFMFVTIPLKLYIKKHGLIALDIASYQPTTDSQKDCNGEQTLKRKKTEASPEECN